MSQTGPPNKPYAYDPLSGEYLCPCHGTVGQRQWVSLQTGQIYCEECATGPAAITVFNPYDLQQYCVCE
jgi:hypothetical protein